jgi:murein tripeptide amidase MpaA
VKKNVIGKSLTGLDLPVLHISNHQSNESKKKNIVVTGRVHPGESNSSLILNGFISYMIGSSREAEELRNKCNFFIIPMLNPDGVVLGNTRGGAAGKDLNR